MNNIEAYKFVDQLLTDIWEKCKKTSVKRHYSKNLAGIHGGNTFDRDDILKRQAHFKANFSNRKKEILEAMVIDEKIVARIRQTATQNHNNEPFVCDFVAIYKLRGKKIKQLWIMSDHSYLYDNALAEAGSSAWAGTAEQTSLDDELRKQQILKSIKSKIGTCNNGNELTPRQLECLFYTLRGSTAKEIAATLGLSHRTIEAYIDIIKRKYNCTSKQELINKLIPYWLYL